MSKLKVPTLTCLRCGHTWVPRSADVRQCPNPKCHSVLWDVPPKKSISK